MCCRPVVSSNRGACIKLASNSQDDVNENQQEIQFECECEFDDDYQQFQSSVGTEQDNNELNDERD